MAVTWHRGIPTDSLLKKGVLITFAPVIKPEKPEYKHEAEELLVDAIERPQKNVPQRTGTPLSIRGIASGGEFPLGNVYKILTQPHVVKKDATSRIKAEADDIDSINRMARHDEKSTTGKESQS